MLQATTNKDGLPEWQPLLEACVVSRMAQGDGDFAEEVAAHVAGLKQAMAGSGFARAAWARRQLNEALRRTERGRRGFACRLLPPCRACMPGVLLADVIGALDTGCSTLWQEKGFTPEQDMLHTSDTSRCPRTACTERCTCRELERECPICLDRMEPLQESSAGRELMVLPCCHVVHNKCWDSWLQTAPQDSGACPVCRLAVDACDE